MCGFHKMRYIQRPVEFFMNSLQYKNPNIPVPLERNCTNVMKSATLKCNPIILADI